MPISENEFVFLCEHTGFSWLPIKNEHIYLIKTLTRPKDAPKHQDPFDRMLIAQAKQEGLILLTHDSLIPYYEENCIMSI